MKTNRQVICKVHDLEHLQKLASSAIQRVDQEVSIWSHLDHVGTIKSGCTPYAKHLTPRQPNIIAFQRAFRTEKTM